jgi:hypothetical protein
MIDASDKNGIAESKKLLHPYILDDSLHAPILILCTKTDKPKALSQYDLFHHLGLFPIDRRSTSTHFDIKMCNVWDTEGCANTLKWLSRHLG